MEANVGYYNNDKPVMTDYQYDLLKDYVEDYHLKQKLIIMFHILLSLFLKIRLNYRLRCGLKIGEKPHLVDKRLNPEDIIISAKLDGISVLTKKK